MLYVPIIFEQMVKVVTVLKWVFTILYMAYALQAGIGVFVIALCLVCFIHIKE